MSTLVAGPDVAFQAIDIQINQTDLLASTTQQLVAPMDGYWDSIDVVAQVAVTTGGTVTPKNNSQAVYATDQTNGGLVIQTEGIVGVAAGTPNPVAGLQVTVPNATAVGAIQSKASTPGDPSLLVKKGQLIQLVLAGFATAGALNVTCRWRSESLMAYTPLVY